MFSIFCRGDHKLWLSMLTNFFRGDYKLLFVGVCKLLSSVATTNFGLYKQNQNAELLQQHRFWAGLMAIFRVAVLLFIKPKLLEILPLNLPKIDARLLEILPLNLHSKDFISNFGRLLVFVNVCRGVHELLLSLLLNCCREVSIVVAVSVLCCVVLVKLLWWCLLNLFAVTLVGHSILLLNSCDFS